MCMLSMTGNMGVASRAKPAVRRLKVSPGSASSQKIGISRPASNDVLCPYERSKDDRGISAAGTSAKLCFITERIVLSPDRLLREPAGIRRRRLYCLLLVRMVYGASRARESGRRIYAYLLF